MRHLQHDSHAPPLTSDILNILCGFFTAGVISELLSHTTWFPTFYSLALSLEVAGQDRTAHQPFAKHLLSCASCLRTLRTVPPPALDTQHPGTEAGVAAGAQHLQKITTPKRVGGETAARVGVSRFGFSLASLNISRREGAKAGDSGMQDTTPGSRLPLKPTPPCLHCNWHLTNITSDTQPTLWYQCWLLQQTKATGNVSPCLVLLRHCRWTGLTLPRWWGSARFSQDGHCQVRQPP